MKSASHPIWAILDTCVIGCLALGALWITATEFDETELKAIGAIIVPYVGWKFSEHRMQRAQKVEAGND